MGPDIAALVASALFGTAAIVGAAGAVFLGAKFLRQQGQAQADLRRGMARLEDELGEIQERLDTHERLLQKDRDPAQLK